MTLLHANDDEADYMLLLTNDEWEFIKRSVLTTSVSSDVGERATAKLLIPYRVDSPPQFWKGWWLRALDLVGGSHGIEEIPGAQEGGGQESGDPESREEEKPCEEEHGEESREEANQEGFIVEIDGSTRLRRVRSFRGH
jgi:hypothetical protein